MDPAAIAAVLLVVGGVWFFQGIGVIEGSFMTGEALWAVIGVVFVVAGIALLASARARVTPEIPAAVHDILHDKPTGFVATVRPDGSLSVYAGRVACSTTASSASARPRTARSTCNLLLDDRITDDGRAPLTDAEPVLVELPRSSRCRSLDDADRAVHRSHPRSTTWASTP